MWFNKKNAIDSEEYKKALGFILDLQTEIKFLKGDNQAIRRELESVEIQALEFKKKYKTQLAKQVLEEEKVAQREEEKDIYNGVLCKE
jgi:hypothetical protein